MIVIYHNNCWDGFGAAWVAHKIYPDATFIPANYGDQPPDVVGQDVLMVDFSYTRIGPDSEKGLTMDELASKARTFKVLDHHKTAAEILKNKPYAVFDMKRSGAGLAWDVLMAGEPRPKLIDYVEDRDLWNWNLPYSKQISALISSYNKDFDSWDILCNEIELGFYDSVSQGRAIMGYQEQVVKEICQHLQWKLILNYWVPVVNTSMLMSEVGEFLCLNYQDSPFAAYYFDRGDGKRQWGLRSRGEFDVSEVAKKLGGGGHKNAAGFLEELSNLKNDIG